MTRRAGRTGRVRAAPRRPPTAGSGSAREAERSGAGAGRPGCTSRSAAPRRADKGGRGHAPGAEPRPEGAGLRAGPSPRQPDGGRPGFQKVQIRRVGRGRERRGRGGAETARGETPRPRRPHACPAPVWVVFPSRRADLRADGRAHAGRGHVARPLRGPCPASSSPLGPLCLQAARRLAPARDTKGGR